MFFQNFALIEGRLTQAPEIKTSKNGARYSRFSICYNEPKKLPVADENGNSWTTVPHFFNVVAWDKVTDILSTLNKGDPVSIIGKFRYSEWQAEDGSKRSNHFILADSIRKLSYERKEDEREPIPESPASYSSIMPPDETIPF